MSGSPNLHQGFVNAMGFNDKPNPEEREIGDQCVWTVSSCKHGYGVKNLRDGQRDTYWQSDGVQPHLINMEFQQKTAIKSIKVYLNYNTDESYTPNKIAVKAGTYFHDLQSVCIKEFDQPRGWEVIELRDKNLRPISAFLLQIIIVSNHQNGRDCRIRQVKIQSPTLKGVSSQHRGSHLTSTEHPTHNLFTEMVHTLR
jgi:anaphase-promoting complex subunit 10